MVLLEHPFGRFAPILLEELNVLLQYEELNMDITQTSSSSILTTAMVASKDENKSGTSFHNHGGKSNFCGRGRGLRTTTKAVIILSSHPILSHVVKYTTGLAIQHWTTIIEWTTLIRVGILHPN